MILIEIHLSFLGNFGGVFSLFIGLSVVSFFEIGMYFTVYLYRNYQVELQNSGKVDTFSKRATHINVKAIQEKVLRDLHKTLDKY